MHATLSFACRLAAIFIVLFRVGADLAAQDARPVFEVASVRPNPSTTGPVLFNVSPRGEVTATRYPALWLVTRAYELDNLYQLSGNPAWLETEYFDVRALAPEGTPPDQIPLMLQSLLADRFKLRVRWETREEPIYALVRVRTDGRLGPNIRPSQHDCAAFLASGRRAYEPDAPRTEAGDMLCGGPPLPLGGSRPNVFGGAPVGNFVRWLNDFGGRFAGLDRPVVDGTDLKGNFDIMLSFAPAGTAIARLRERQPDDPPDTHQALEEQLGLRLERRDAPLRMLVIESVERPMPE